MRKIKVSILALSVLVGGVIASSAFYDVTGKDYPLNARFIGQPTNIVIVSGIPRVAGTDWIFGYPGSPGEGTGTVYTDGGGKIYGVGYTTLYLAGLATQTNNYIAFIGDVKGSIGTKGSGPVVKMTMKANGYSKASAVYSAGPVINLNFTSTGLPIPHPAQVLTYTNQTVISPGVTGIVYTVKYFDDATVYTFTNDVDNPPEFENERYVEMAGTMSGSYKTSAKDTVKLNKAAAVLSGITTLWALDASGNFVQTYAGNGGIEATHLDNFVQGQIINPGTKLYAASDFWSGKGTTSTKKVPGTYKLNFKGVGVTAKSTLNTSGDLGDLVARYLVITNTPAIVQLLTNSATPPVVYSVTNTTSGITKYWDST